MLVACDRFRTQHGGSRWNPLPSCLLEGSQPGPVGERMTTRITHLHRQSSRQACRHGIHRNPGSHGLMCAALGLALACACGGSPGEGGQDASIDAEPTDAEPTGDANLPGAPLVVTARAVDTCGQWLPDHQPGLSYQTPSQLRLGIQSVEIMTSHRDPAPVALTLSEPLVEVDASEGASILSTLTGTLPEGTYSHIRVGVAYALYRLQATAHGPMTVPGALDIDITLSGHERTPGQPMTQGQYTATFTAYGNSYTYSGTTPLNCMLSAWGGIAATSGPRFQVRVPIPGGPLSVAHTSIEPVTIDLLFPMQDTFAWRDLDVEGYSSGVLDIAQPPSPGELPDAMVECHLLMADRCEGHGIAPIHPTWPMPDSSIDFCSDGEQVMQSCPQQGEPAYGQDAQYSVNSLNYDVRDQVVLDRVTGLEWQRAVPLASFDWWEARDHCAALLLDGSNDWRLPSRVELVSLLDFGELAPTIDLEAFPDTPSDFFWTSSPVPFLNLAYGVRFELGFIYDHDPYGSGRVRCVRGTYTAPEPRFTYDAEVVADQATGLEWQRQHQSAMDWLDALAYCEGLDLGGHQDWRLPNLKEQQTLVDDRRLQPCIDVVAFPGTPAEWFWSSTPIQYPPNEGWSTSFTDGYASIHAFTELHLVRCLRDP